MPLQVDAVYENGVQRPPCSGKDSERLSARNRAGTGYPYSQLEPLARLLKLEETLATVSTPISSDGAHADK